MKIYGGLVRVNCFTTRERMPFSSYAFQRLDTGKHSDTDEFEQQTNESVVEDESLAGYSLNFAQPKDSFAASVRQSCASAYQIFMALLYRVLRVFGRWPVALVILICYIVLTVGLIVGALTGRYHEFRKDISLESFMVPDIKVSSDFAAFNAAKKHSKSILSEYTFQTFLTSGTSCIGNKIDPYQKKVPTRKKRSVSKPVKHFQRILSWTLDLVYVAKTGDNIFTKECLQEIHKIENKLMNHKDYTSHCYLSKDYINDDALRKYGNCTPPYSLINLFYASKNFVDGQSEELRWPIGETLKFLKSREYFFSFVADDINRKGKSNILRAQILFGRPVKGISAKKSAQKEEFKRFVTTYVETLDNLNNNKYVCCASLIKR